MNLGRGVERLAQSLLASPASRPVRRVNTRENVVALTFDDGPDPLTTPRLLDILAGHGASATFFLIGEPASRYPDLVARIAAEGHVVANHTWDHPDLTDASVAVCRDQIERCAAALGPTGARFFRPPYGRLPRSLRRTVAALGYTAIKWDVSSEDWQGHDAAAIAHSIESQMTTGSIVLCHDGLYGSAPPGSADRTPTLRAVDQVLERGSKLYRFVTISELLGLGLPSRQPN